MMMMVLKIINQWLKIREKYFKKFSFLYCSLNLFKVRFVVQANDKTARLSKQRAVDLVDKEYDNEIRRSVKRSNLVRRKEFKNIKKNQKKTGNDNLTL